MGEFFGVGYDTLDQPENLLARSFFLAANHQTVADELGSATGAFGEMPVETPSASP
jgi:hypothetical protein